MLLRVEWLAGDVAVRRLWDVGDRGLGTDRLTGATGDDSRGDRIAVVGANGCGKSSLLRLLAGRDEPDDGNTQLRKGLNVSYLAQVWPYPQQGSPPET